MNHLKKIDTSALDEMISTSLANSKSNKDVSLAVDERESDNALNNDKSAYSQTSDTSTIDDKTKDK